VVLPAALEPPPPVRFADLVSLGPEEDEVARPRPGLKPDGGVDPAVLGGQDVRVIADDDPPAAAGDIAAGVLDGKRSVEPKIIGNMMM